jgi:hypothetical protein
MKRHLVLPALVSLSMLLSAVQVPATAAPAAQGLQGTPEYLVIYQRYPYRGSGLHGKQPQR